ncbi:MAG TPA: NAD(P)H-dependent oxidoreductase subunit E [Tissierellaceae bacterium]
MTFEFNLEENKEKIEQFTQFIEEHKDEDGAVMPILQEAQRIFKYLPEEIIDLMALKLGVHSSHIYGVATFYSQFTFIPEGKNKISVCLGTACYVKGAQEILEEFKDELGIDVGETTEDLNFSIIETRCVGDCGLAPVVTVNEEVFGHFKKDDVKDLVKKYKS